jgi:CRP-like cAMP-binding protein
MPTWFAAQETWRFGMTWSPFARKIGHRFVVGASELRAVSELHGRRHRYGSGGHLILQGYDNHSGLVLASGWAIVYKAQPDGSRQIVNFKVPGDFVGVRSMLFRVANLSAAAITPIEASEVTENQLGSLFTDAPGLAPAVMWAVTRDGAMAIEHLVGVRQRRGVQRLIHLLLELEARLRLVGLACDYRFFCPLTPCHLADALDLEPSQISAMLCELHEAGLLTFQDRQVTFHNHAGLVEFAQFDPGYLDHGRPVSQSPQPVGNSHGSPMRVVGTTFA